MPKTEVKTNPALEAAKSDYANARKTLREAIAKSQKALYVRRQNGTVENVKAYEAAHKVHLAALDQVRATRSKFYALKIQTES